ncbi:pirin family protein [Taibaiella koreensis]|uniref:pirin family protein n=1 Tax=Taibaiella koreensis TaxID=1268548 RepID=UPI000E59FC3E|nr:pirin family protein [Taibaiella koreensis]
MNKSIEKVFNRPPQFGMVGDGFRVYNYIPGQYNLQSRLSPFLMLDFNPAYDFGKSEKQRGVDVHPHKGFETVTIAYKGSVAHHDSAGNSGVIYPGDVQWMTAGAGILHKEYHEQEFARQGGPFEMVQLWVNLPAKDKPTPPGYQSITATDIVKVSLLGDAGIVNVIAGSFNGARGPARTFTEVNLFDIKLKAGGKLSTSIPATHNTAVLVIEGGATVNGALAAEHSFTLFRNEGEEITIEAGKDSVLLLMSGMPIDEPIASYGPFVMNTQQEILEAIQDFQAGKFGTLA